MALSTSALRSPVAGRPRTSPVPWPGRRSSRRGSWSAPATAAAAGLSLLDRAGLDARRAARPPTARGWTSRLTALACWRDRRELAPLRDQQPARGRGCGCRTGRRAGPTCTSGAALGLTWSRIASRVGLAVVDADQLLRGVAALGGVERSRRRRPPAGPSWRRPACVGEQVAPAPPLGQRQQAVAGLGRQAVHGGAQLGHVGVGQLRHRRPRPAGGQAVQHQRRHGGVRPPGRGDASPRPNRPGPRWAYWFTTASITLPLGPGRPQPERGGAGPARGRRTRRCPWRGPSRRTGS